MDDLEGFLDKGTGAPETQADETEATQPETIGQPRDEIGRFAPKETGVEESQEDAESVPPTEDQLPPETFKGLKDERGKRQGLEREIQALKDQIASMQKPEEPPAPPPSMWEDEQGWQQHFGAQISQQASLNAKLDLSEMLARRDHSDFDDMKAEFLKMASDNPALAQQALADPDPWGKAYTIARNAATMAELGATNVAEIEAKLREKLEAEYKAQPAPQQSLPQSLADSQSSRVSSQAAPQLLSLEDILKPKR